MEKVFDAAVAVTRGPMPPRLVCLRCRTVIAENWTNPILELMLRLGRYDGDVTGGVAVCDDCMPAVKAEFAVEKSEPTLEDCPAIMADAIMGNYRTDATNRLAVEQAFMWLSQGEHAGAGSRDLYIFGPTGTGKTRLAISLARACPMRARYVRVPALLRQIRDGFSADEGFPTQPFVDVPLLILDDLGAEKPSAFSMQTLETLYTERMDAGRRTIFTSNLPMQPSEGYARNLVEQLDDARFISRLFGAADRIELTGVDRRLR